MMLSPPLAAQSDEDRQRAEELYREGAQAYHTGDFSLAIMKFKSGNDLDPNPMFLYNIAVSYGRLGNVTEAYDYGTRAHEGDLPREAAQKNTARLRSWKLAMRAEAIADATQSQTVAGCTSNSQCESGQQCDLESQQCVVAPPPTVVTSAFPRLLGWSGIGLAAIGLGLTTGAIVLDMSLSSDFDLLDEARADQDDARADRIASDIESTQSTGRILLFAGIGTVAVGTTLILFDLLMGSEESSTALFPAVTEDSIGIGVHQNF